MLPDEQLRTSTAWLEFTPSTDLVELLGPFIKAGIRNDTMAMIALRSENSAKLSVLPIGGGMIHKEDELAISSYGRNLERISFHQLPVKDISGHRTAFSDVKFSFNVEVETVEMNAIASFEKLDFDRTKKIIGVYALLPIRKLVDDMTEQALARDRIIKAVRGVDATDRRALYVTNPRWTERIDFISIVNDENDGDDVA